MLFAKTTTILFWPECVKKGEEIYWMEQKIRMKFCWLEKTTLMLS